MITDKYTTMKIRFNEEERSVLEEAYNILRKVNGEIDTCTDVDEICLSDCIDVDLLDGIERELNELGCTIEF